MGAWYAYRADAIRYWLSVLACCWRNPGVADKAMVAAVNALFVLGYEREPRP